MDDNEVIVIPSPDVLQNMDVIDLINRIDRILLETGYNQSHTRTETMSADVKRRIDMTAWLRNRFDLYAGVPELDLPKYHPRPLQVPTPPVINKVENPDSMQLMNMYVAMRTELAYSDSSERASSFSTFDKTRIETLFDKIEQINEAVENDPAVDTPDVDLQEPPTNDNLPAQ